jgi:hypothetical protein
LFQGANVLYQIADLIFGEFAIKRRHPVLAFADDGGEFVFGLLLHVGSSEGADLEVLAEHGVARSVGGVAGWNNSSCRCRVRCRRARKWRAATPVRLWRAMRDFDAQPLKGRLMADGLQHR